MTDNCVFKTDKRLNPLDSTNQNEPKLIQVLKDDFKKINFGRDLRREYRDISDFYLDADKKKPLSEMPRVKRWILKNFWLLQSMFMRLNPLRRVLVLTGIALYTLTGSASSNDTSISLYNNGWQSGFLLLFV